MIQDDPLKFLLDFLCKSNNPIDSIYKIKLLIPDSISYRNGIPDGWYFTNKRIQQRDDFFLKNEVIYKYFKRFSSFSEYAAIVRIRLQDKKYYSVIDIKSLQKVLSGPSQGLPLQSWDSLIFFIPFKSGGVYNISRSLVQKKAGVEVVIQVQKQQVYYYNDKPIQDAIKGRQIVQEATDKYDIKNPGVFNSRIKQFCNKFVKFFQSITQIAVQYISLDVLKDDNDQLWVIDIKQISLNHKEMQKKNKKLEEQKQLVKNRNNFKCSGCYCSIQPRKQLILSSQEDQTFQYFNSFGNYMLGWINVAGKTQNLQRYQKFEIPYKSILLDRLQRQLMNQNTFINPDGQISTSLIRNQFIKTGFSNLQSSLRESFDKNALNDSVYSVALNQRVFLDFGNLLQIPAYAHLQPSTLYKRIRICWNCFQVYSKIDIVRQQFLLKQLKKYQDNDKYKKHEDSSTTLTSVQQDSYSMMDDDLLSNSLSIDQQQHANPQLYINSNLLHSPSNQQLSNKVNAKSLNSLRKQSHLHVVGGDPSRKLSRVEQTNLISNLLFKGQRKKGKKGGEKLTKTTFNLNKISSLLKDVDQTTKKLQHLSEMANMYKGKQLAGISSGKSQYKPLSSSSRKSIIVDETNSDCSTALQKSISLTALNWLNPVHYNIKQYKKSAPNFKTSQKEAALKKKHQLRVESEKNLRKINNDELKRQLNKDLDLDLNIMYNSNQSPTKQKQRSLPIQWNNDDEDDDDQFDREPQFPTTDQNIPSQQNNDIKIQDNNNNYNEYDPDQTPQIPQFPSDHYSGKTSHYMETIKQTPNEFSTSEKLINRKKYR